MGVEVTSLPTIGEAYSFKTIRQGRRFSISEIAKTDALLYRKEHLGGKAIIKRRCSTGGDMNLVRRNARRVIAFKYASPAQKKVAQTLLDMGENNVPMSIVKVVQGINRSLSLKYREY